MFSSIDKRSLALWLLTATVAGIVLLAILILIQLIARSGWPQILWEMFSKSYFHH